MTTSFFSALNPTSKDAGIFYRESEGKSTDLELYDLTVSATIDRAIKELKEDPNFLRGIWSTFNIIYGNHYDNWLLGDLETQPTKAVLDFFIFPLVARKLIGDTYLDERENETFLNIAAWSIAIPLEIARLSASLALAIMLIPVVLLVHLVNYLGEDEAPAKTNTI